jgi:hypothetical protein
MIDHVRQLLRDIEEDNERLESDITSTARATEYATARESGDPTLRRIGWIAERLHLNVRELAADNTVLPTIH